MYVSSSREVLLMFFFSTNPVFAGLPIRSSKLSISDRPHQGMFINYVHKILDFFDHLPLCVDIFYGMNVDNFKTTYLPRLVNLVCEQLLTLVGVGPARAISKRNSVFLAILPMSSYYSALVHFPQRCATAATRSNRLVP